ncbi:MAG: hypothetical protein ABH828_06335 [archaeon]
MKEVKELILVALTIIVATFLIIRNPSTTGKVVDSALPVMNANNLILPGMIIVATVAYLIISNWEK